MDINYFYCLQVLVISGIFSAYYFICLRKNNKHQLNRFMLLSSILLCLLIPLIKIPVEVSSSFPGSFQAESLMAEPDNAIEPIVGSNTAISHENNFTGIKLVPLIFLLVSLFLLIRFLQAIFIILQKIRKHKAIDHQHCKIIFDPTLTEPFSFFKWIFLPAGIQHDKALYATILAHEYTHARCWHSADTLFLSCIKLMLWWNPFFYYLEHQLRLTHEYEADAAAVKQTSIPQYAEILLRHILQCNLSPVTHSFFQSPIKSRIMMLLTPKKQSSRHWILLPLIGIIVLIFSTSFQQTTMLAHFSKPLKVVVDVGHGGIDHGASANNFHEKDLTLSLAKALQQQAIGSNISIILTRSGDELPLQGDIKGSLKKRVAMVEDNNADLMISLHMGIEPPRSKKSQQGIVAYISAKNEANAIMSKPLAATLLQNMAGGPLPVNTAIQQNPHAAGIYVLDQNVKPAVLLEVGYMSNSSDVAILTSAEGINNLADRIFLGLKQYAEKK